MLACVTAACCQERTVDAVPAQPAAVQHAAAVLVALCQIAVNGVAVVPPVVRTQADRCVSWELFLPRAAYHHRMLPLRSALLWCWS